MYEIQVKELEYETEVTVEGVTITFSHENSKEHRKMANEFILNLLKNTGRIGY